jgi:hypothetical protein
MTIRICRDDERDEILSIINAAAEAYHGVISAPIVGTILTCQATNWTASLPRALPFGVMRTAAVWLA